MLGGVFNCEEHLLFCIGVDAMADVEHKDHFASGDGFATAQQAHRD